MFTMIGWLALAMGTIQGAMGLQNLARIELSNKAEVLDRVKTGTSAIPRNSEGSQMLGDQALTSLVFFRAEGKGQPIAGHCLQCKPINSKTLYRKFDVVFELPTLLSNGLSAA